MTDLMTTNYAEYDFADKSSWDQGEWLNESDKVTWIDPETGYQCIILRSYVTGSLNGYVGIPIYHPAYGISYSGSTQHDFNKRKDAFWKAMRESDRNLPIFERIDHDKLPEEPIVPDIGEKVCSIEVHGGLTYSDEVSNPTKEGWEHDKKYAKISTIESKRFPHGDAAEFLKVWGPHLDDYEAWAKQKKLRYIHSGNSNDENWYFGFDCGHCMDLCPKIEASLKAIGHVRRYPRPPDMMNIYRNMEYVKKEVESLAKQLKALAP